MRLLFLKNYRRILPIVWAVCFVLGFVAGVWIGPGITGMADRRAAADGAPSAQTVSSADIRRFRDRRRRAKRSTTCRQGPEAHESPARAILIMPVEGRTVGACCWRDPIMDDWRFRDGLTYHALGDQVTAALSGVTDRSRAQSGGGTCEP